MKFRFLMPMVSGAAILAATPALAASDATSSGSVANTVVASATSSVASGQTATLIGGAVSSGLSGGGFSGGFSAPSGGFGGGGGGFGGGAGGGFGGGAPAGGGFGGGAGGGAPAGGGGVGGGGGGGAPAGAPGGQGGQGGDRAPGPTSQILNTRQMGKAGAAGAPKLGAWAQGTYVNIDKDEAALQMSGDVYNLVGGVDYKFNPRGVAGVAIGYEQVDIKTKFNSGTYEGKGYTVAPYVGYALTPNWSVDASVGYTWLEYDVSRTNDAVKGSFDATRWFAAGNVTGTYLVNRWLLSPKAGVMYMTEEQDAYNETGTSTARVDSTTIKSGRASASLKFGYLFDSFLPYGKVGGEWDFKTGDSVLKSNGQMSNVDDGGMTLAVGVDIFKGPISGTLEAAYNSLLRDDLDVWQGTARIRYEF